MHTPPAHPGVYVQETGTSASSIPGVATSITAFVGRAERGPVDTPVTIASFAEYERTFGPLNQKYLLGFSVNDFFVNGGTTAVIVRAFNPANPVKARINAGKSSPLNLEASSPGEWARALRARIEKSASSQDPALFTLRIRDMKSGVEELFIDVSVSSGARDVASVLAAESLLAGVIGTGEQPPEPDDVPADENDLWTDNFSSKVTNPDEVKDSEPLDEKAFGDPGTRRGLYALDQTLFNLLVMPVDEITAASDAASSAAQKIVRANAAAYCREHRALYIVDPPAQWKSVEDATEVEAVGIVGDAARFAALYFPRVMKANPVQGYLVESFTASGTIAGVIARTDAAKGVWSAPAGIEAVLLGVEGLDINPPIHDAQNETLNPLAVNCLRQFPVYGNVVWGARTMRGTDQLNDDYKYIPVRRLANFIEESLINGLKWTVFEPNNELLWSQIRSSAGAFMQSLYAQGAFHGLTANEAYWVACDGTTTTQADIDGGIVNVIVGFAPWLPAEFLILQIQLQAAQGSE